ncbi:MAG: phenol hydroxylase subunit P4 [Ilumatobacteraceae bacterium]
MAVKAVKEYVFDAVDTQAAIRGAQLTYIGWLDHLMFCAPFAFPLPPDMPFGAIVEAVLPGSFGQHPDFAKIDWSSVEWAKGGKPFHPDFGKSLADNGMRHKDSLTFRTPGLTGFAGSSS